MLNIIGYEGAKAISDLLKENALLTDLDLSGIYHTIS